MTLRTVLRGSAVDRKPLMQCVRCLQKREQAGGVVQGLRFICNGCVLKRTRR